MKIPKIVLSSKMRFAFNIQLVFISLSLVFFAYLQTYGSFNFRNQSTSLRSQYFSAQSYAILKGHFNTSPVYLDGWNAECMQYKGVCNGYFGIFPSLIRIPADIFFGSHHYFIAIYLLLAFASFLIASWKILVSIFEIFHKKPNQFQSLIFFSVTVFSPITFLAIRDDMYEEAILWGISNLIWVMYFALKYYQSQGLRSQINNIIMGLLFGFFAMHSRAPEGVDALAILFLVLLFKSRQNLKVKVAGLVSVFGIGISYIALNLMRFGVVFPSATHLGGYVSYPARLAFLSKCGDFNVGRIPFEFLFYFFPNFHNYLGNTYGPGHYTYQIFGASITNSCIEQSEYFSPYAMTYLLTTILAIYGLYNLVHIWQIRAELVILLIGLMPGSILMLGLNGLTERYLADFFPIFTLLSVTSLMYIDPKRFFIKLVIIIFCIYQAVTFSIETKSYWNVWPDKPAAYYNLPLTSTAIPGCRQIPIGANSNFEVNQICR